LSYRILVFGGYGLFGGLIVKNLLSEKSLDILVASRSLDKAQEFIDSIQADAICTLTPAVLDAGSPTLSQELAELNLNLLIHTCGPYQEQNYHVAEACIRAGVDYIDLADGREFVNQIDSLDSKAKANNCLVISGASSVPGLSSVVVKEYIDNFSEIDELVSYILPGNQTPRGIATIRSILSYVGKPISIWKKQQQQTVYGWQDLERVELQGLGTRWAANCDVPDLTLFHKRYPQIKTIRFQAGLELSLLQLGTWLLSWFSRVGLVKNWAKYASPLKTMSEWFYSLGSNAGGMRIDIKGKDNEGKKLAINWQLIVLDGKGIYMPTIAATLLTKKLMRDELNLKGAMPCMEMFSLDDFKTTIQELGLDESVKYHYASNSQEV